MFIFVQQSIKNFTFSTNRERKVVLQPKFDEMKIKRISLSKVLKLELPELLNDVLRIIEKYKSEHQYLEKIMSILKEHQQLTDLLEVPRKAHPLTEKIQLMREKELQYVGAIVSHMQFIVRADIDSMRHSASIAKPVVKRFLSGLRKNNESVINQIIKQFLGHLKKHPEVENALSDLGLQPFVDELRKVNVEKLKLMSMRISKPKPKVDSRFIQKKVQGDLRFVFDAIDALSAYKEKSNYGPLIQELNQLLTRYATIIHTRKTHNKRRAAANIQKYNKTHKDEKTPLLLPNSIETLEHQKLDTT